MNVYNINKTCTSNPLPNLWERTMPAVRWYYFKGYDYIVKIILEVKHYQTRRQWQQILSLLRQKELVNLNEIVLQLSFISSRGDILVCLICKLNISMTSQIDKDIEQRQVPKTVKNGKIYQTCIDDSICQHKNMKLRVKIFGFPDGGADTVRERHHKYYIFI